MPSREQIKLLLSTVLEAIQRQDKPTVDNIWPELFKETIAAIKDEDSKQSPIEYLKEICNELPTNKGVNYVDIFNKQFIKSYCIWEQDRKYIQSIVGDLDNYIRHRNRQSIHYIYDNATTEIKTTLGRQLKGELSRLLDDQQYLRKDVLLKLLHRYTTAVHFVEYMKPYGARYSDLINTVMTKAGSNYVDFLVENNADTNGFYLISSKLKSELKRLETRSSLDKFNNHLQKEGRFPNQQGESGLHKILDGSIKKMDPNLYKKMMRHGDRGMDDLAELGAEVIVGLLERLKL